MLVRFKFRKSKNAANKTGVLYCTITLNGTTIKNPFSTGVHTEKKFWDTKNQLISNSAYKTSQLEQIKADLRHVYEKLRTEKPYLTAEDIKTYYLTPPPAGVPLFQVLAEYLAYRKSLLKSGHIGVSTYKGDMTLLSNLKSFVPKDESYLINRVDATFAARYEMHLKTRPKVGKLLPLAHNSAMIALQKLSRLLDFARDQGYILSNPLYEKSFAISSVQEKSTLTATEIELLENFTFQSKTYVHVRDMFLFQLHTGFAFGDMYEFSEHDHTFEHLGKVYIRKPRQKARPERKHKQTAVLPYFEKAQKLYQKYSGKFPVYTMTTYNRVLKEIIQIVGIEKKVTSHVGRKSAIHSWLEKMGRFEIPAKMAGHASSRVTESTYAKISERMVIQAWEPE
jgi:integrase